MVDAVPYFELHIKPMFRRIDRDHMLFELDLWDYDDVKNNSQQIKTVLRRQSQQIMPPINYGGGWPEGWISVFELWVDKDFPRLSLTSGNYKAQRLSNGQIKLSANVMLTDSTEAAWLNREESAYNVAEYTLYLRPVQGGATGRNRQANSIEIIADTTVSIVFINDVKGRQEVPISV